MLASLPDSGVLQEPPGKEHSLIVMQFDEKLGLLQLYYRGSVYAFNSPIQSCRPSTIDTGLAYVRQPRFLLEGSMCIEP